jgi:DNA adenine methylase
VKSDYKNRAQPFVKWAGGKRQIQEEILSYFPRFTGRYFEPFLGGGAMFFRLQPENAILSDVNAALVNVFKQMKTNHEAVVESCNEIEANYNSLSLEAKSEYFYDARIEFNSESRGSVKAASLFLFLNKAGFNGIYRENRQGEFNVPFGKREKIQICDIANIKAVSEALKTAEILDLPIEDIFKIPEHEKEDNPFIPKEGDFIYLDPPYIPLTKTAAFTSYTKENFGHTAQKDLQERLAELIKTFTQRGVGFVLSNSSHPETLKLYQEGAGMDFKVLDVSRNISATSAGRKPVQEHLFWNSVVRQAEKHGS